MELRCQQLSSGACCEEKWQHRASYFQDLGAPVCSIPVLCSSLKVTFKKTKRRVKKIRKKEKEVIMRADDLLPLGDQTQDGDFGSRLAWTQ